MTDHEYTDVERFDSTEYAVGRIRTEYINGNIEMDQAEFGIRIHRDGPNIGLCAGTKTADKPALTLFHDMTPEQARAIGQTLQDVADKAEQRQEELAEHDRTADTESFIRRLLP